VLPGDIVVLAAGDLVPADVRIISGEGARVAWRVLWVLFTLDLH
jgi:magnesium-transporting ATPase (P-type)